MTTTIEKQYKEKGSIARRAIPLQLHTAASARDSQCSRAAEREKESGRGLTAISEGGRHPLDNVARPHCSDTRREVGFSLASVYNIPSFLTCNPRLFSTRLYDKRIIRSCIHTVESGFLFRALSSPSRRRGIYIHVYNINRYACMLERESGR